MGMFPRFCCSRGNVSASRIVCLHNHHNQAKSWECFHDFVAAVGMFVVSFCLHNHHNQAKSWEYFCVSRCLHRLSSKSWYYCISLISLRLLAVSGSCELWLWLRCVGTVNVVNCNKFLPTMTHHTAVNATARWLACGNTMR